MTNNKPGIGASDTDPVEALLDHTDDMLALLDTDLRYLAVNDAFRHMFGQPKSWFMGRSGADVFAHTPEHYEKVIKPSMESCLRGDTVRYENWVEVPKFGRLFFDIRYSPARDATGAITGVAVVGRNRTEMKRTIEALEESETLLNRTEHLAHLGGWFFDVRSGEIEWTNEMYHIHEVDRDFELTQDNINAFFPDNQHEVGLDRMIKRMQGKPSEVVMRMLTRGGRQKWVRSVAFPVFEDSQLVSIQGILQDITEYITMQQKLRQSEEKYRSLVEETNALTWEAIADPFRFTYMSPQAGLFTGHSADAWCEPGFMQQHIHPDDGPLVAATASKSIAERRDFILEYRLHRGDGSWIWLHDNVKIVIGKPEEPLRLRGTMIDITTIKEMQAGLNRALRELESYKYILDQHAIVSMTDRAGHITYVNDKFLQLTGYSREELLGQWHSILKSDLHGAAFYADIWDQVSAGNVWQGEICSKSKNGSLHWVYNTIVPLRDDQGGIEAFMSVRTDITDLKRTEESLRRAQKMDAIGQLTGGIAHDFNNLLGIIFGNLELIEMALPENEKVHRQLDSAKAAAMRGSVLTRRLLNFSHQTPVQGKTLSLNRVLGELEVLISKSLTALIAIRMDLAEGLWQVDADPGDFEDVIINLALNAGDAMTGGGTLSFTTCNRNLVVAEHRPRGTLPAGQYVEIRIQDTGCGIDEQLLDKIFDPYFSTKPSDKGSGLGLAMVYGFVQRSKGLIFVDSMVGRGTVFTIFLPRSRQETGGTASTSGDSQGKLPARPGETLLLVDDEIDILEVSTINLERLGYEVIGCANAEEALQVLESDKRVDLLFTDIVMPGRFNGHDLGEAAHKLRPDLKILFTTGYDRVENRTASKGVGNQIISKPYRIVELSRKIRAMLDGKTG